MEQLLLDPQIKQVSIQAMIDAAGKFCIALESLDGNEHMVVLDKDGQVLFTSNGVKNCVSIPEDKHELFMEKGAYVIHNHPSGCSLSLPDLIMATMNQIEIWAFGKGGNSYYSKGFSRKEQRDLDVYQDAEANIIRRFQPLVMFDRATDDEGNFLVGHATNLLMRHFGVLDYKYNFNAESKALYAKFAPILNKIVGFDLEELPKKIHTK